MTLVKIPGLNRTEPLTGVDKIGLDLVVVDTDAAVRVSDGEVHGEVVVDGGGGGGGGGEVEGGEGGGGGVEFDFMWAED